MDLHRLRVVGFDTTIREKEGDNKHIAEHENHIKEETKTSSLGNGDENQCLNENGSLPGPPKKCLENEVNPPGSSKKYLEDTPTQSKAIKICVNDDRTPLTTSRKCSNGKIRPFRTAKKYQNDTTFSLMGTPKTQRSKSEIFNIPSKKNPKKRALKINSSDTGLTKLLQTSAYSHRKKRTLNLRNRSRHARIHQKEENDKENTEVHFLFARAKPSFTRDCKKRTDNERTKTKRVSKFPNDIYGFQTSNRSLNQFQYQMSHFNFIDTDKIPFKKLRVGFHRKPKPPQPVTNCFCKYHAMRVLNSAYGRGDSRPIYYNLGTHPYPRRYQPKYRCNQEERLRRERPHYMTKDEIVEVSPSLFSPVPKSLHDARTGPSNVELAAGSHHRPHSLLEKSTTLQNFTIASEYDQKSSQLPSVRGPYADCAVSTDRQSCELKKSQTFQDVSNVGNQKPCTPSDSPSPCTLCAARAAPAINKSKKKRKKKKKPFLIMTLCYGFLSRVEKAVTDFHLRNNISRKRCIKYFIFGMLIVVWSPCLLAVILAWVVMFPWKLTNILRTDVTAKRSFPSNNSFKRFRKTNLRREYQQMCFESCTRIPEKKRSFMTSAASWYSRTVGVVVNSFNAVISLLGLKKKTPTRAGSLFFPSSHPNPRKRYKLFYADNRGWVIKPLRRRSRSCTSNRVVQSMRCELRPKFWQKLKCQNLQQASYRKVPCPVHGTDSCPMHQYSPAGDGYPVQSRKPGPDCTCQEKYSQRPAAFTPLSSHNRPQQEVNIPLTLSYTTSGIAPISAAETVNTKLTNTKIINNIAHKKIAKDRYGHRKYRTLPFSVVPEDFIKHDAVNTLIKAAGVEGISTLAEISNHIPCCTLHRLRRETTKREIPLNCLSARSPKLTIGYKNSPTRQKKIYFSNKCVLTDIVQSTIAKHANTSAHKVNYAHKMQNISNRLHQKVTNTLKTAKAIADIGSKCACDVELLPPKQVYTYKTDRTRTPAQKYPSSVKIKSSTKYNSIVNYSFEDKRKQSKQGYKYKPGLFTTHMLSNKAKITTMTNRHIDLDNLYGNEHEKCHYVIEHKPHQISIATQKQLCTADITTSTNRNVALNCSPEEDHGQKRKPHQIPVATQKQTRTADNTTGTKLDVAVNFPCKEDYKLEHSNQSKPHQISVATQIQLKTADITTCTNCNVATNCRHEEKHKISERGYKHIPHQIVVASQMQSRIAENATDMNRDPALMRSSEEKNNLSKQERNTTQIQQRTVDTATGTNRDLALNYSGVVTLSTVNKEKPCMTNITDKETKYIQELNLSDSDYKYLSGQIPIATQKQSYTADITTMTNCDIAVYYPSEGKHAQSEQAYKYKSDHISVGTQKQPSTADIITNAKYLGGFMQSTPDKSIPQACLTRASEKNIICTQKTSSPEYISKTQDVSIQKRSNKIDVSTDYVNDYERSKTKEQTMSPNKIVNLIDVTTSWEKRALETQTDSLKKVTDYGLGGGGNRKLNGSSMFKDTHIIAYSTIKEENDTEHPMRALSNKIVDCGIRQLPAEELIKQFQPHSNSPRFGVASESRYGLAQLQNGKPYKQSHITEASKDSYLKANNQQFIITTDYVCGVTHNGSVQNKPNYKMEQITSYNANTHKSSSAKEPPNKQSLLQGAMTHTGGVQEGPKLFGIASDCTCRINQPNIVKRSSHKNNSIEQSKVPKESRQYGSKEIPVANTQGFKTDSASARLRKPSTESSPISTNIQELPCDCKCECNSVLHHKSKIPQHLPSAQPGISKKDMTSSKFLKSPAYSPSKSSQKPSPQFGIASDCRCGEAPPKNEPAKEFKQMAHSKHTLTHKSGSVKHPPSKHPNLIQPPPGSVQEQPKFVIASDCKCGINQTTATEENLNNVTDTKSNIAKERKSNSPPRNSKHLFTHKTDSAKEPPSKQPNLIQATSRNVQEQSKFVIASDCKCGTNQTTAAQKNLYNNVTGSKSITAEERKSISPPRNSKHVITHKTDSAKEPPTKQHNLIQATSRSVQEHSKFVIAPDCKCGTKQTTAAEKNLYNNITGSKSTTAKERKSNSPQPLKSNISTFSKSRQDSSLPKRLARKCLCQDSLGELPYGSKDSAISSDRNIVKVDIPRSKFTNSPERSHPPNSLARACRCPIKNLPDSVGKSHYSTKYSKLSPKRSVVKLGRTQKSSDHTPPDEYLQQTCPCAVAGLQNPIRPQSPSVKVSRILSKGNSVEVDKSRPNFEKSSKHAPPHEYLHLDCTCPVKNPQETAGKKTSQRSRKSIFGRNSTSKSFDFPDECPCSAFQNDHKRSSLKSDVPANWNTTKRSFIRPRGRTRSVNESSSRVQSSGLSQYSTKVSSLVMSLSSKLFSSKNKTSKLHENHTKILPDNFSSLHVKSKKADRVVSTDDILMSLEVEDDKSNQSLFPRSHKSKTQSNINQQSKTSEHSSIMTLFTRNSNKKRKQAAKKFDPQYSSTLINYQLKPTVRQTVRSQLEKSKNSSIVKRSQSKPLPEKIRPLADKMSTYSLKDKQERRSPRPGIQSALINSNKCACSPEKLYREPKVSEQSFRLVSTQPNIRKIDSFDHSYPPKLLTMKKEFELSPQQLNADQVIPIISGTCKCAEELKITKERLSNHKQFQVIPQPPKPKKVISIISGRCMCAEQHSNTIEKLQLNTNLSALENEKQPEPSQHLANQTLKSSALNWSQLHASHQTDTPHNAPLRNFQSVHETPCKCSFKQDKQQELSKSLHKAAKNKRSQEKLPNSNLISHVCICSTAPRRLREHIVHRSEIFQNSGVQAKQNLPVQKGFSKIPSNVDKPPELLQQHPPGLGRQSTAEREVQQPYPDFNRVSIRYPGHKSPPKQSLQIPGINGLPPANNYPPAPGATPPDPCYTNSPKICRPKSPYDETALRRAYKRRPLRYTPPRHQLPRVVMIKKLKENKPRAAEVPRRKGTQRAKNLFKCLRNLVSKTEREVFPEEVKCNPIWLNSLKRKPCFCIYKLCPRVYPAFLNCYNTNKNLCQLLVYFITLCFWSPFLLCGYLCCNVCCKCC